MYKGYYLPYEYGWMKLGGVGGPGGGGKKLRWYGPPIDFFYSHLWWFIVVSSISLAAFSTACH